MKEQKTSKPVELENTGTTIPAGQDSGMAKTNPNHMLNYEVVVNDNGKEEYIFIDPGAVDIFGRMVEAMNREELQNLSPDSLLNTVSNLSTPLLHLQDDFVIETVTPYGWDRKDWLNIAKLPLADRLILIGATVIKYLKTINTEKDESSKI